MYVYIRRHPAYALTKPKVSSINFNLPLLSQPLNFVSVAGPQNALLMGRVHTHTHTHTHIHAYTHTHARCNATYQKSMDVHMRWQCEQHASTRTLDNTAWRGRMSDFCFWLLRGGWQELTIAFSVLPTVQSTTDHILSCYLHSKGMPEHVSRRLCGYIFEGRGKCSSLSLVACLQLLQFYYALRLTPLNSSSQLWNGEMFYFMRLFYAHTYFFDVKHTHPCTCV